MRHGGVLAGVLAAVAAAALASACGTWQVGNRDGTLYRELPPQTPPEKWLGERPTVAVVFDGVFRSAGDGPLVRDENASFSYARLLRKAGVFARVGGPDVAAAPEVHGRVRIEIRYEEDLHDSANLAKAAIAPGLTAYRLDLTGTSTLHLALPGGEPARRYAARTTLTRLYYRSQRRDLSRRILYREVDELNFLALVQRLRAEPLLFGLPGHPGAEPPPEP